MSGHGVVGGWAWRGRRPGTLYSSPGPLQLAPGSKITASGGLFSLCGLLETLFPQVIFSGSPLSLPFLFLPLCPVLPIIPTRLSTTNSPLPIIHYPFLTIR